MQLRSGKIYRMADEEIPVVNTKLYTSAFDGTGNVREFISSFELHKVAREWNDETAIAWLPLHLKGRA